MHGIYTGRAKLEHVKAITISGSVGLRGSAESQAKRQRSGKVRVHRYGREAWHLHGPFHPGPYGYVLDHLY